MASSELCTSTFQRWRPQGTAPIEIALCKAAPSLPALHADKVTRHGIVHARILNKQTDKTDQDESQEGDEEEGTSQHERILERQWTGGAPSNGWLAFAGLNPQGLPITCAGMADFRWQLG